MKRLTIFIIFLLLCHGAWAEEERCACLEHKDSSFSCNKYCGGSLEIVMRQKKGHWQLIDSNRTEYKEKCEEYLSRMKPDSQDLDDMVQAINYAQIATAYCLAAQMEAK